MRMLVEGVISFYLFICFALMLFNILYIMKQKRDERRRVAREEKWIKILHNTGRISDRQADQLRQIKELTAFYNALEKEVTDGEDKRSFYQDHASIFQMLALEYEKHSAMEKAFFAYVLASFDLRECTGNDMLARTMLRYFDHSTVYCRENVLHALYALGKAEVIEHGFDLMSENDWYHNPKLIADGLSCFKGDQEELTLKLWEHHTKWQDFLLTGIVQYASNHGSKQMNEVFSQAFKEESLTTELRFALIRYFQHHPEEKVQDLLSGYCLSEDPEDEQYAIASASALQNYPSQKTIDALIHCLHSRNWYVRKNAAFSLSHLGKLEEAYGQVTEDRYAMDILDYAREIEQERSQA